MRSRILILLAVVMPLFCSCANKFQDIKVTSFDIKSLNPVGLAKLQATVELGVSNPAPEIHVSDMMGVLKFQGSPCLTITTEDVVIEKKSDKTYTIPLTGTIDRDFEVIRLLKLLRSNGIDDMTVDISAHAALKSGLGKDIEKKDIPLKDLIDKI